ncbi:hypothetical protein ACJW31_12G029400 [Castanea mollissima]
MAEDKPPWRLTGFYGQPEGHQKHESWRLLRHLHAQASLLWVCLGDYNEILNSREKQGGIPEALAPMLAFKETLLHCGLEDLGYHRYPFTWRNGRPGEAFIKLRLDRACASIEWKDQFPLAKVSHMQVTYSDHDPILLNTQGYAQQGHSRRKNIHRFEERWVAHQRCEDVIRAAWTYHSPNKSPMFRLFEKIKRCHMSLVAWSRRVFDNTRTRLEEKQATLMDLSNTEYGSNLAQIKTIREEINELLHQEEVFWRQRSRVIWLPAGDKNTKFFHKQASQRWRKNQIDGLMDEDGIWRTDEQGVGVIAEEYFFFKKKKLRRPTPITWMGF